MTELEAIDLIKRGHRAKALIEDDMVAEAIAAMRADAYEKIEKTRAGDKDERESLYMYLKAISNFEAFFAYTVEEGHTANTYLEEWRAKAKAARRRPR